MWQRFKLLVDRSRSPTMHGFIIFLSGTVVGSILQTAIQDRAFHPVRIMLLLLFVCLAWLSLIIRQHFSVVNSKADGIATKIDDLGERIGLTVRYLEYSDRQNREVLFRELRQIVQQATKSIVIVNSYLIEEYGGKPGDHPIDERRQFYDTLLARAREAKVRYRRIVQLDSSDSLSRFLRDQEYLRHFWQMVDERERSGPLIGLFKASAVRPYTYTIVDGRWLMLAISELSEKGLQMRGVFIFDDPQQQLVTKFMEFSDAIVNGTQGAITRGELPPCNESNRGMADQACVAVAEE